MRFLRGLAATVLVIIALCASAVLGYQWLYPTYVVRYRLTVNAVAGDQAHTGSSVVEVHVRMQPRLVADMPPWNFGVRGEATFIDLGSGRNVLATLIPGPSKGSDAIGVLFKAFRVPLLAENAADLKNVRGARRLEPADWPAFATFSDVTDPLSVEPVDPSALEKNLGINARIESVLLTITDDPVTHNLEQTLPWLAAPLDAQQVAALSKRHFSKGAFVRNDP